jgi:hypothetical protein
VGAAVSALAGFVFLVLATGNFLFGGGVLAFFALPLAIVLEAAAVFSAVRTFVRRRPGARRGAAIGAFLVALPVAVLAAAGLVVLFTPKQ